MSFKKFLRVSPPLPDAMNVGRSLGDCVPRSIGIPAPQAGCLQRPFVDRSMFFIFIRRPVRSYPLPGVPLIGLFWQVRAGFAIWLFTKVLLPFCPGEVAGQARLSLYDQVF